MVFNRENSSHWVDDLQDVASEFYNRQARRLDGAVQSTVGAAINNKVQRLAEVQAKGLFDHMVKAIPSEEQLNIVADEISNNIIMTIHQQVLPQLFNEIENAPLKTEFDLENLYIETLKKIPMSVTFEAVGLDFDINMRSIFSNSFTFADLMNIYEKLKPAALRIKNAVVPVVEKKAKNIAGLCLICGVFIGGISTFAYIKLYNSAK